MYAPDFMIESKDKMEYFYNEFKQFCELLRTLQKIKLKEKTEYHSPLFVSLDKDKVEIKYSPL